MKFVRSWKEARISAYQASSKTLTFWVVAIVFFVSAVVGQAQTPQALSAASYVPTATKLVCVAQTRALCGSAAVCADLANALFVRTARTPLEPLLPQTGRKRRSALRGSVF